MKLFGNLNSFLRNKESKNSVIIFDIESASIGGAVVSFDKKVPHISYSTRTQLPFQEVADEKRLLTQIEEVLTSVASDLQKNGLLTKDGKSIAVKEIVCVLSSLWSNTQTTNVSFENKEKFKVTNRIMDDLLAKIHASDKKIARKSTVTIEKKVINSLLNGYPTEAPLGKEVTRINITFLESTVSNALHAKMSEIMHSTFNPDIPLVFRSFTLVAFSVTRDLFNTTKNFMLIDVTGEITEIAVVRNSILEDMLSFPYGKNTIVRDVAKKTKSIPEDILTRIKIMSSGNELEVKEEFFEAEKKWTEMFGRACDELSSEINPLPRDVFLVVDNNYKNWFRSMIERVDFSQFTVTKEMFHVDSLTENQKDGTYTLGKDVVPDNFLIVNSLFYNREYLYSDK